jgi:monoamine oxidase
VAEPSILIIGGGIAGLTAADLLSAEGLTVVVLEARDRIGGRIHTVTSEKGSFAVELGAEFIHGAKNEAWPRLRSSDLAFHEVPDRHWDLAGGKLKENSDFWDLLAAVTEKIDTKRPDLNFASFIVKLHGVDSRAKWLAREYIEGFHAARPGQIGIHAIAKSEEAAERAEGKRQFRLAPGYSPFAEWLAARIESRDAVIHCNRVVRTIRWRPGSVEVAARTSRGPEVHTGSKAIITLPLGVLKAIGRGGIDFVPAVPGKNFAIKQLRMGQVVKVTIQFRSRFWPVKNFGFIHTDDEWFPTWWADERGPVLTGWVGGPRAAKLASQTRNLIVCKALDALTRIFKVTRQDLATNLVSSYHHDWSKDPYSKGAYSYTAVGGSTAPGQLAAPASQTLFFAGEATATDGDQGTVHGAMKTGERAANELLGAIQGKRVRGANRIVVGRVAA